MYPKDIQKLIGLFSQFPTVGSKTAARFVFYLAKLPKEKISALIKAINSLKDTVKICPSCFKLFEGDKEICEICSDNKRDKNIICVVEKEIDLETIEKTKKYNGFYLILGRAIRGFSEKKEKEEIEKRIELLEKKIKKGGIKEIILALNPTTEGQNMALWIKRKLNKFDVQITQLGRGLPIGSELEYADEETLAFAFQGRS